MSYLHYLYLFACSGVKHILCCVFFLFVCLVYPMLSVSLDYLFLISPSVFSNVYLNIRETVPSISTASSSTKALATDWSISILTSFDGKSSF